MKIEYKNGVMILTFDNGVVRQYSESDLLKQKARHQIILDHTQSTIDELDNCITNIKNSIITLPNLRSDDNV